MNFVLARNVSPLQKPIISLQYTISRKIFFQMNDLNKKGALKLMIENLSHFKKSENSWTYLIEEENSIINISLVHIQGEICKTAGFSNEILILDDGSAKAKVTIGSSVPGDFSWIKPGVYCSVVGSIVENGKLVHIAASKIANITNMILKEMWPWEVKELKSFLLKQISPSLQ